MTGDDVDRFFTLFAKRQAELSADDAEPRLADGDPPRGLVADGLVRTTGWLQFGTHPISSGLVAAVAGLPVALVIVVALLRTVPPIGGLIALLPALCYGAWRVLTTRLFPASPARNIGTTAVEDVAAGSWVRLHGTIGPVAQVASIDSDTTTAVAVTFVGGASREWPRGHRLHVAEVID